MRKVWLTVLIVAGVLGFLAACRQPTDGSNSSDTTFNARRGDGSWYEVDASLVHTSEYAVVYVERGYSVSPGTAAAIGTEFDNVYEWMVQTFGPSIDVDGNGRVALLLLDIQDDFAFTGAYIAGYFDAAHLFSVSSIAQSNEADMLFMDLNPGVPGDAEFKSTLVHEMQHLVSFARAVERADENGAAASYEQQDTWINEGLSMSAEYLYLGSQLDYRRTFFNQDTADTIRNGNTFYDWADLSAPVDEVLADYASAYLFFQWFYIHSDSDASVFNDVFDSSYADYRAVEAAAVPRITGVSSWDDMYTKWLQANLLNRSTGLQGYRNVFSTTVHNHTSGAGSVNLPAGGAVYSSITGSYTPTATPADIVHQGVTTSTGAIDSTSDYSGDRLITYNSSTALTEVTGVEVPPQASVLAANDDTPPGRNAFSEPYRIDAPFQHHTGAALQGLLGE